MLNVMRENLRHLKWLLWIVALSLTLYLGSYFFTRGDGGAGSDWAARVDGTPISRVIFLQAARNADRNYRQLLGDQYEAFKPQLQLGRQVIQTLIDQQIILQEAEKLEIEASPAEISKRIVEDPAFQDPDGKFVGKELYARFVERNWYGGVSAYERSVADNIVILKWRELVTAPIRVSDEELARVYRDRNERTEIDYVVVAASDQKIDLEVGDEELTRWYEAHADDYQRAEGRRIRYVVVERQSQLADVQVTDQEVAAFYTENGSQYTRLEQRRARHILFSVPPDASPEQRQAAMQEAEQTLARLKDGESFEDLARTLSDDTITAERGGDLGFLARGSVDPGFERALFDTPVGQLAPVTSSPLGYHVVEVVEDRPGGIPPLEELREAIRDQLLQARAEERVDAVSRALRDEIASPEDLVRVAERDGLEVRERLLVRDDRLLELGAGTDFMDRVFELSPGVVSAPLPVRPGRALVVVDEEVPPAVAPLEDVRDRVKSDILNDRSRKSAIAAATRAMDRRGNLAGAARALGLEVRKSGPLVPGQAVPRTGGSSPELREALFGADAGEGGSGVVPVPAGALVYEVTRRDKFDPAQFEAAREALREEVLDRRQLELLDTLLTKLRQQYEIEINQALIDQVSV